MERLVTVRSGFVGAVHTYLVTVCDGFGGAITVVRCYVMVSAARLVTSRKDGHFLVSIFSLLLSSLHLIARGQPAATARAFDIFQKKSKALEKKENERRKLKTSTSQREKKKKNGRGKKHTHAYTQTLRGNYQYNTFVFSASSVCSRLKLLGEHKTGLNLREEKDNMTKTKMTQKKTDKKM